MTVWIKKRHTTRLCVACRVVKPLTPEHWHRRGDGFQSRCKPCNQGTVRERQLSRQQAVAEYKESKPCADCGEFYPFYVMDLDHLPEFPKTAAISAMIAANAPLDRIFEEIAKCELVCSNCHRKRTWLRATA
jgi:hypothetical protein